MRKRIVFDKIAMSNYGYSQVPLKQILMLDLTSEEMVILLNFFGNSDTWTIGSKGISERSFYREKNKKRVRTMLDKLKDKGYIKETEEAFVISIFKIQQDYKVNTSGITLDNPKEVTNNNPVEVTDNNPVEVTDNNPVEVTDNNLQRVTLDNLNKMNTKEEIKEIKKDIIRNNQTIDESFSFESESEEILKSGSSLYNHSCTVDYNTIPIVKNELQLLIESSKTFNYQYYKNSNWYLEDLSRFTNANIALKVFNYDLLKTDQEKDKAIREAHVSNTDKHSLPFFCFMVRQSRKIPNSEIWKNYVHFCTEEGREDLIKLP